MQFRATTVAALSFFLARALAQDVVYKTIITEVEVTSTVTLDTVTVTGEPEVQSDAPPVLVELTTLYPNTTALPTEVPSSTNVTVPSPTVPEKDSDSAATSFSGSMGVAAFVGAAVAIIGML